MEIDLKPNFYQIPNIFVDYWMKYLIGYEFNVFIYIYLETLKSDGISCQISRDKISKKCGISLRTVDKCLNVLIGKELLEKFTNKDEMGHSLPSTYKLNFENIYKI